MPKRTSSSARAGVAIRRRGESVRKAQRERSAKVHAEKAKSRSGRHDARQAERREAILAAALTAFSERGFTAARLDDVAQRAGIAKGTIYLYFRDKETLFQELIRTRLLPIVGTIGQLGAVDVPVRVLAGQLIELFVRDIVGSPRRDVIRLMISEGARFPKLADFYYDQVVSPVMTTLSSLLRRAYQRGELADASVADHPQLLAAPAMIAIIWNGLFDRRAPLDIRALMTAHVDLVLRPKQTGKL
jgi:AcrR family transcriptional regulator